MKRKHLETRAALALNAAQKRIDALGPEFPREVRTGPLTLGVLTPVIRSFTSGRVKRSANSPGRAPSWLRTRLLPIGASANERSPRPWRRCGRSGPISGGLCPGSGDEVD
jgi:hypothetical protein